MDDPLMNKMNNKINSEEFFQTEYSSFAAYDLIRKIGHIADGMKNASRKILHYSLQNNVNTFQKVTNLSAAIQQSTEYLHGSLEGTVVNMAQDFVGSNNLPILLGDGTFGTRFIKEPAASRYIFAKLNPKVKYIFNSDDYPLLEHQEFEGTKIEPKYYVSTLPMILVNGSVGVSVGYSQKILPRKIDDIINAIKVIIDGGTPDRLIPYYVGYDGEISAGAQEGQWLVKGKITRQTKTQIIIDEIPLIYSLQKYIQVLEKLQEDGKIKGYADESEDDKFRFIVAISRETSEKSDEELLNLLKLVTPITENYTAIGLDNKVVTYSNEIEMIKHWLEIRLHYNLLRKDSILNNLKSDLNEASLRSEFIGAVISKDIIIEKKSKSEIVEQIKKFNPKMEPFINSFMGMPLWYMTDEKIQELNQRISQINNKIDEISTQNQVDILMSDLKGINL